VKQYVIEDAGPIFLEVMGPFLGMQQLIEVATRWIAGNCLIDKLQHDMLRFMSPEAAKSILVDYNTMFHKSITALYWSLTWFEKQIIIAPKENNEESNNNTKRKKMIQTQMTNNKCNKQMAPTTIHHNHTQQATKVLSASATTEDSKRVAQLASQAAELQDNLEEMSSIVGKISDTQYHNQNNIKALQSLLERVD
jgi:Fe2+ transport system protein B